MSLLSFPNEILYLIAKNLKAKDLSSLLRTNSFFAALAAPLLQNILVQDKDDVPVLCWAAGKGYRKWCHLLLEKKLHDVNTTPAGTGLTPLHEAAKSGHESVLDLLLQRGAIVNALDIKEETPLHHAAKNGQKGAAHLLLLNHADVDPMNHNLKTPLFKAIGRLVKAGYTRESPEDAVVSPGSRETVILLLKCGANVFHRNIYGENALHQASGQRSLSVLKLILELGGSANLEARENRGNTALHMAVIYGQDEVVKLLLGGGANINARNMEGDTPLHLAVEWRREAVLETLVDAGVDVNALNSRRYTALSLAVYRGYERMVVKILEAEPCFDSCCNAAALYFAVENGRGEVVDMLLEGGAQICMNLLWRPRNRTVLHLAVQRGYFEIAKSLLRNGADTGIPDLNNKCAFCAALENGSEDLIDLFTSNAARCKQCSALS
ncbi:hypothetical protein Q9L58_005543 [Maublancomyces gigas]|uniref:Ankyrin repeat-containing domain protein n=1 Tax=Discina gigas TaxID=1032678 RepID=A0ABR3GHV2_9PEZI